MHKNRGPNFTHFISIPFINPQYKEQLSQLQNKISDVFSSKQLQQTLRPNNPNLFHLTISMLTLPHQSLRTKIHKLMEENKQKIKQLISNTKLTTDKISYFTFKPRNNKNREDKKMVNVIYLDLKKDQQFKKVIKMADTYIRILLKQQIIVQQQFRDMHIYYDHNTNMFLNQDLHITLFRCENLYENNQFLECFEKIKNIHQGKTFQCQYVDISTRGNYDVSKYYTPLHRIVLKQSQKLKPKQQEVKKQHLKQQTIQIGNRLKQKIEEQQNKNKNSLL